MNPSPQNRRHPHQSATATARKKHLHAGKSRPNQNQAAQHIAQPLRALPYEAVPLNELNPQPPAQTLFLIGNGFDLMHGVPSRYTDFRDFLGKRSDLRRQLETWNLKDDLWSDFEDSLAHMDDDAMLATVPDWMDTMGVPDEAADDFSAADFFAAAEWAVEPLQVIQSDLQRQLRRWAERLRPTRTEKPLASLLRREARYLNFNYTEFLETIYGIGKAQILYLHGDRRVKGQELILGHAPGAEDDPLYERDVPQPHIFNQTSYDLVETAGGFVSTYYEATEKKTDAILAQHREFFSGLSDIKNVVVIGHSLSCVDAPYFRAIHAMAGDAAWALSWHSPADLGRIPAFVDRLGLGRERVTLFQV